MNYEIQMTLVENQFSDPMLYKMETKAYPDSNDIVNMLFQAIEIEGLDNSSFECDYVISRIFGDDYEFVNHEECKVTPHIIRTSEPSKYVQWGNKKPHIFAIDRKQSHLEFEY